MTFAFTILFIALLIYPVWMFIKLARYGDDIFRPDFNLMEKRMNQWVGLTCSHFFNFNRPDGKIMYYLLLVTNLIYLIGFLFAVAGCLFFVLL